MAKELEVYEFCEQRWDYYEKRDNGYYPSKHDKLVFNEASEKFQLSVKEVERAFNKIAKLKADMEIGNMTKEQMKEKFKEILEGNKETPWGALKK